MLLEAEEEDGSEEGHNDQPFIQTVDVPGEEPIQPEVSLNSVIGLSNPKTMKMLGLIGEKQVVVMIDPGATHNFISLETMGALTIPIEYSGGFGVSLGNGTTVKGEGICKGVTAILNGGVVVEADFLPLELGNCDLILGVQWLETLGTVWTNWKTQVMHFVQDGVEVTLAGDPALVRSQISLKAMLKALRKEGQGYWVEFNRTEVVKEEGNGNSDISAAIPGFLRGTVEHHRAVFNTNTGLPPKRGHEHEIHLRQDSQPVGVRPYRYPQSQKDEIEKLIGEMLAAGIIKPSTSPFSSPVLLVKKRDGSWRFCVDYRALNKETIPDKYPIPVIDELLDELHGFRLFSKLDLWAGYHQILVREEDTHKTAFRTHDGHYEFVVMPFGLMNAPATFQSLISSVSS